MRRATCASDITTFRLATVACRMSVAPVACRMSVATVARLSSRVCAAMRRARGNRRANAQAISSGDVRGRAPPRWRLPMRRVRRPRPTSGRNKLRPSRCDGLFVAGDLRA